MGYVITDGRLMNSAGLFFIVRTSMPKISEMKEAIVRNNKEFNFKGKQVTITSLSEVSDEDLKTLEESQ